MKTAKELIKIRETLISDIKKNWERIRIENVVVDGTKRNYNVQGLYKSIIRDAAQLVEVKIDIQLANMGFKSREQMPVDCIYPQIYTLQQLKEQKVKLGLIPTGGKSAVLSSTFIFEEVKSLEQQILTIEKLLEDFNESVEFAA